MRKNEFIDSRILVSSDSFIIIVGRIGNCQIRKVILNYNEFIDLWMIVIVVESLDWVLKLNLIDFSLNILNGYES